MRTEATILPGTKIAGRPPFVQQDATTGYPPHLLLRLLDRLHVAPVAGAALLAGLVVGIPWSWALSLAIVPAAIANVLLVGPHRSFHPDQRRWIRPTACLLLAAAIGGVAGFAGRVRIAMDAEAHPLGIASPFESGGDFVVIARADEDQAPAYDGSWNQRFTVRGVEVDVAAGAIVSVDAPLRVLGTGGGAPTQSVQRGEDARIVGRLLPPRSATEVPVLIAETVSPVSDPHRGAVAARERRNAISSALLRAADRLGAGAGSLFRALLLGDQSLLSPEDLALFRESGSTHILALSGMHLGILVALVLFLSRPVFGKRWSFIPAAFVVVGYLALIGPRPALVRAGAMFLLAGGARFFGRKIELLDALSATFVVMAIAQPLEVFSTGFALSFAALLGIALFARPVARRLPGAIPNILRIPLAAGIAAQITTLPIVVFTFDAYYPIGVVAAIAVTPVVVAFLTTGIVFVPLFLVAPWWAQEAATAVLDVMAGAIRQLTDVFSRLPGIELTGATPKAALLVTAAIAASWFLLPARKLAPARKHAPAHRRRLSPASPDDRLGRFPSANPAAQAAQAQGG